MLEICNLLPPSPERSDHGSLMCVQGFAGDAEAQLARMLPANSFQYNHPSDILTHLRSCVEGSGGRKGFAVSYHTYHK